MKKMNKKQETILIVDDEPVNVKILEGMLSSEGYKILRAYSGKDALSLLGDYNPDIILLDVMMPEMDGFEVCKRIKQNKDRHFIPVLMVTALQDKAHKKQALYAGADDFLCKPIDRTELIIRVRSLLRIKQYSDALVESYNLLEKKNIQLKKLEEAKEVLTHMIVHDLRGPLTSISMNLDFCLIKMNKDSNLKDYLQNALYQCDYLNRMIQGLLDIYKMEKGKLELQRKMVSVKQIIDDVIFQFRPQLEAKEIKMDLLYHSKDVSAFVDPELIKRVIGNLVDNAIRHTPKDGEIKIEIFEDLEKNLFTLSLSNTGHGIDEKYLHKIFDKFEQVNLKKEGVSVGSVGLGLAFCKMVIEQHGGTIEVRNRTDKSGCTFSFSLPLHQQLGVHPSLELNGN